MPEGHALRGLTGSTGQWNGTIRLRPEVLDAPLHWRKPRRIFVCSMSDLFHEQVPEEFIDKVFAVMALCPQHTFMCLSKRAGRMQEYYKDGQRLGAVKAAFTYIVDHGQEVRGREIAIHSWPLLNVWLGVSAEDQKTYDDRSRYLKAAPAAVRFLSLEPLLGPIILDWRSAREMHAGYHSALDGNPIHWVIVGGESGGPLERALVKNVGVTGHPARSIYEPKPEALAWVRSIRAQCQAAGVKWFFKAWGGPTSKSGGRLLDGRTWDEYPCPRQDGG